MKEPEETRLALKVRTLKNREKPHTKIKRTHYKDLSKN